MCVASGPIRFQCPANNFAIGLRPYLVSASISCQPCAIQTYVVDTNLAQGQFSGTIAWGPNMINGAVDESHIDGYTVLVVDDCGLRLSVPGGPDHKYVPKIPGLLQGCCTREAYSVSWSLTLPQGYGYFMVVPYSSAWGELDAGPVVPILDDTGSSGVRAAVSGAHRGETLPAAASVVLLAILGLACASASP